MKMVTKISTKELIFVSFRELAEKKKLEDISINDIVENCDVSRATFYRYFKDKYDLMDQYYQYQIEEICKELYKSNDLQAMQTNFNDFVFDNLALFSNLGKYQGQNNFFDIIYGYCVNLHVEQAKKYYDNDKIPEELLFAIFYHASGGVAMLKKIILNKELNLSKEQYTNYYKNCMPEILKEIYV